MHLTDHDQTVLRSFTTQAAQYAAASVVTDADRIRRMLETVKPHPEARVLDVATGSGVVAMAFAQHTRDVIGVDLTQAVLKLAEQARQAQGLSQLRFEIAHAEQLPFEDGGFDLVVCRFAFHHFLHPGKVLHEMTRVCRNGGMVVVEDLISSDHQARADFQNAVA